jgi:TPR repeat protein
MDSKHFKLSLVLLIGIAASVVLYQRHGSGREEGAPTNSAKTETHSEALGGVTATSPARIESNQVSAKSDLQRLFSESRNYWDFSHEALPAAKAGNADAQFYLSRAMQHCEEANRMYFQHRGQPLSLDEGLRFAVQRHLSIEVAQSTFDKCHEFQTGDPKELGDASEWLAMATKAGQPLAQATSATKMLVREKLESLAKNGSVTNPEAAAKSGNEFDPRALLSEAVKSKDPEVLFTIGEMQGLLHPSSEKAVTAQFAWMLVACQRGFDCSANADWVKNTCGENAQCAAANGQDDPVRTLAGDHWPEVQQLAREISANLDADRWPELDFEP